MTAAFFKPYINESFYSLHCRNQTLIDFYPSHKSNLRYLGNQHTRLDFHLGTNLDFFSIHALKEYNYLTKKEIVDNHTIAPFLRPFLVGHPKIEIVENGWNRKRNDQSRGLTPPAYTSMKQCKECVGNDLERYGVTYWNRLHAIPNWNYCPIHHCSLEKISPTLGQKMAALQQVANGKNYLEWQTQKCTWFEVEINNRIKEMFNGTSQFNLEEILKEASSEGVLIAGGFNREFYKSLRKFVKQNSNLTLPLNLALQFNQEYRLTKWSIYHPIHALIVCEFYKNYQIKCIEKEASQKCKVCGRENSLKLIRRGVGHTTCSYRCDECEVWFNLKQNGKVTIKCVGMGTYHMIHSLIKQQINFAEIGRRLKLTKEIVKKYARQESFIDEYKEWQTRRDIARTILLNTTLPLTHHSNAPHYYFLLHNDREELNNLSFKREKTIATRTKISKAKPKIDEDFCIKILSNDIKKLREVWPRVRLSRTFLLQHVLKSQNLNKVRYQKLYSFVAQTEEKHHEYKLRKILEYISNSRKEGIKISSSVVIQRFQLYSSERTAENVNIMKIVRKMLSENS